MIPFRTCLVLAAWLALSDGASARLIRQFGQVQPSYGLAYSPDGKLLASSGSDGILRLWDPATGKEVRQLQGGQVNSWSIAFSPDSKLVAAPCADSSIHVWEVATGKEVHQLKGHQATVWCIAASPAGNTLASWGRCHRASTITTPIISHCQIERESIVTPL